MDELKDLLMELRINAKDIEDENNELRSRIKVADVLASSNHSVQDDLKGNRATLHLNNDIDLRVYPEGFR